MFFFQFLVGILPLGFGSVGPHIFADPDPGSRNPKHWSKANIIRELLKIRMRNKLLKICIYVNPVYSMLSSGVPVS